MNDEEIEYRIVGGRLKRYRTDAVRRTKAAAAARQHAPDADEAPVGGGVG